MMHCWSLHDLDLTSTPGSISVDGVLVPKADAVLSVLDRAPLYGDAAYTTMKVAAGKVVFLDRHLRRLQAHLTRLMFGTLQWSFDLRQSVLDLVANNAVMDGLVRVTVSRGQALMIPNLNAKKPLTYIFTATRGTTVKPHLDAITTNESRDAFRDIKTVNRMVALFAIREARLRACDEAIFCWNGQLVEGTGNNLFGVINGLMATPDLTGIGMPGIVREVLLESTTAKLQTIPKGSFAPLFLTNSLGGVMPIHSLDGVVLPRDEAWLSELRSQLDAAERREAVSA